MVVLQVTGQSLSLHTSDWKLHHGLINLGNVNQNTNINSSHNHAMPFENKCLVQTLQSH